MITLTEEVSLQDYSLTTAAISIRFSGCMGRDPRKNPFNFGLEADRQAVQGFIFFAVFPTGSYSPSMVDRESDPSWIMSVMVADHG